ncbi:hypothetical protein [Halobellus ordinarius]|uniref:hypothetical protein n=1 Tax=Halobellus ordinarius TaxID=3075120 RepID=UPI0028807DF0|nr:hypothetical protein [Halobellus sp. ZY16]
MTDALDAVVDAALERALLSASDARRYFALAGALERARIDGDSAGTATGTGVSESIDHAAASLDGSGDRVGPLGAALMSTLAAELLDDPEGAGIDVGAWSPGQDTPQAELVGAGAVAASRRLDVDIDVLVARSGLSREELARHRAAFPDPRA